MQEDYGKIIAQNIRRIAWESQKTQADIARDLNLKQATVSSWMNGTRIPRMGKIDLLCHYFNCSRADIMEEYHEETTLALSRPERELVMAYRAADELTRQMVSRLLGIDVHQTRENFA